MLAKNIERHRFEAEILLAYVLQKDRIYLHTHSLQCLNKAQEQAFFALVKKRIQKVPIEYLTHRVSFYEDEFFIDFGALIPRPESEILAQKVIDIIRANNLTKIAEIGVGSAALSISVAKKCPNIHITATDISPQAIQIAHKNIQDFELETRIHLIETSLLDGIDGDFELVFSNPPYIALDYPLDESVLFEPKVALYGGKNGSEILESIIVLCAKYKVQYLLCEIGYDQASIAESMLKAHKYHKIDFYKDLAGFTRGFIARLI